LKKREVPEVWITELEDLRMLLEDMGSTISYNPFMIHVLNKLTLDHNLQLELMERRVGDTERTLSFEEIKVELSFNAKGICEEVSVGNGKTMNTAKVGNLKCKVIQLDGSSLEVILLK
jgi:hypothetical protein